MMRRRILNVGGTEIWLHLATLLFAAYMIALGRVQLLAVGFASILLHEGAHAAVSAALGNPPRDVEITPLGALMRLEDEDALPPLKRFAVLLAGPAVTLVLAFGAIWLTRAGTLSMDLGRLVFSSNLAILLINLRPRCRWTRGGCWRWYWARFAARKPSGARFGFLARSWGAFASR